MDRLPFKSLIFAPKTRFMNGTLSSQTSESTECETERESEKIRKRERGRVEGRGVEKTDK